MCATTVCVCWVWLDFICIFFKWEKPFLTHSCVLWCACGWLEFHWLWNRLVVIKDSLIATLQDNIGCALLISSFSIFLFLKHHRNKPKKVDLNPLNSVFLQNTFGISDKELYLIIMLSGWLELGMSALFVCSHSNPPNTGVTQFRRAAEPSSYSSSPFHPYCV